MKRSECYQIVKAKGDKVLENREKYRGLQLGDHFRLAGQPLWKKTYTILFFYKDKVFDMSAFICGYDEVNKESIFVSYSMVELINKKDGKRTTDSNLRGLFK